MAKQSGLGDNFYVGGYDLSGDISAVGQLGGGPTLLDVTGIKEFANERIGGLRAGDWQFTSFMENAPSTTTPGFPLTTVPVPNPNNFAVLVTITGGTLSSVKINGVQVGTTAGTYVLPALANISVTFTVAPTWAWVAVGTEHQAFSTLPTADEIAMYFHGTSLQNIGAAINGKQINYDPTRDNSGNLSLAVEIQSNSFGMEWGEMLTAGLRTDTVPTTSAAITDAAQTTYGAQAYIMCTGLVGTSVTVAIQHATTSGGSYTALMTSGAFSAVGAQRLFVANTTTVDQYLKVVTTGTFTYAQFAVLFCRNIIPGVVF